MLALLYDFWYTATIISYPDSSLYVGVRRILLYAASQIFTHTLDINQLQSPNAFSNLEPWIILLLKY